MVQAASRRGMLGKGTRWEKSRWPLGGGSPDWVLRSGGFTQVEAEGLLRWRQKEISTHKTGSKGPASQRGLRVTCMQFPEILVEDADSWAHQGLQKQTLRRGGRNLYFNKGSQ